MRHGAQGLAALCLSAVLAAAALAAPAAAQSRATANAQAVIQMPGSIAKVYDLDFGKIAQNNSGGTVVLSPDAAATCTVTGGLIRSGVCQAATFSVYGRRNWTVRVKSTQTSITLNGPGGATMQMSNLTFGSSGLLNMPGVPGWNLGRYNITTLSGFATFWVGGTLTVNAAQAAGVYNGTIVLQVQFN